MKRDYYAVLGIGVTASSADIKRAYRRLARRYSPDINFWDVEASSLFEEIAQAYRVLSDPTSRSMYDRFGGSVGDQDALPAGRRGDDLHVTVVLAFAEAARGATVHLEVNRYAPCAACAGAGCHLCGRRGVRLALERLSVRIPAGVDTGTEVRVSGRGHAGPFGGPRGDLIVSTRVDAHPLFSRKGDNLHCEVPITIVEALLGARIEVPTLDGDTTVVIPPGTQSGAVHRVRGLGVPRLHGHGVGDLYVTTRVEVPRDLDARTQELVVELGRLLPAHPRVDLRRCRGGRP